MATSHGKPMRAHLNILLASMISLGAIPLHAFAEETADDAPVQAREEQPERNASSRNGEAENLFGLPEWVLSTGEPPEIHDIAPGWTLFDTVPLFRPLFADPREPRAELTLTHLDLAPGDPTGNSRIDGFAFVGDTFSVVRYSWEEKKDGSGDGVEIGAQGMVTGEVGLVSDSNGSLPSLNGALINADFIFGTTLAARVGGFGVRGRYYHQSSHLGDELLLKRPLVPRINLSYEAVELIVSYTFDYWRVHAGGAFRPRIDPNYIRRWEANFGFECRTKWRFLYFGRLVLGYNIKLTEYHEWAPEHSIQFGMEMGDLVPLKRNFKILFEYYNGHNPNGQFFLDFRRLNTYGVGFRFAL